MPRGNFGRVCVWETELSKGVGNIPVGAGKTEDELEDHRGDADGLVEVGKKYLATGPPAEPDEVRPEVLVDPESTQTEQAEENGEKPGQKSSDAAREKGIMQFHNAARYCAASIQRAGENGARIGIDGHEKTFVVMVLYHKDPINRARFGGGQPTGNFVVRQGFFNVGKKKVERLPWGRSRLGQEQARRGGRIEFIVKNQQTAGKTDDKKADPGEKTHPGVNLPEAFFHISS